MQALFYPIVFIASFQGMNRGTMNVPVSFLVRACFVHAWAWYVRTKGERYTRVYRCGGMSRICTATLSTGYAFENAPFSRHGVASNDSASIDLPMKCTISR